MTKRSPLAIAKLVLGVGVAVFFGGLAFRNMDWRASLSAIREADPVWMGLALGSLAVDYLFRCARWWMMLRALDERIPLSSVFMPFLGSIALNNVLPFRSGDIVRAVGFRRHLGLETSQVVGTMVVERVLDLLSLILVFAVAVHGAEPGAVPPAFVSGMTFAAVVGCALLFGFIVLPHRLASLARGRGGKASEAVARLCQSLAVMRSPSRALGLAALSIGAWAFEGATFSAVAVALHSGRGAAGGWFAMSLGTLATLIPSTPGYVGTFDFFTKLAFSAYGVSKDASSIAALAIHVTIWLPLTVVGLTLLAIARSVTLSHSATVAASPREGS